MRHLLCKSTVLMALTCGLPLQAIAAEPAPIPASNPFKKGQMAAADSSEVTSSIGNADAINLPSGAPLPLPAPHGPTHQVAEQPRVQVASAALVMRLEPATAASVKKLVEAYRRDDLGLLKSNIGNRSLTGFISHWLYLRNDKSKATFAELTAFAKAYPGWADMDVLHRRAEAALWYDKAAAETVIAYFAGRAPMTLDGRLALVRAERQSGRQENARRRLAMIWQSEDLSATQEKKIISEFGALLTRDAHAARFHYHFLAGNEAAAKRLLPYLAGGEKKLAESLLKGKPSGSHPSSLYLKAQKLRRDEKFAEAAKLLEAAPKDPAALVNPDAWWRERKILIRNLLDENRSAAAYQLALDARPVARDELADALFHRGWIALRYAGRPQDAVQHFSGFRQSVSTPISLARGDYWMGRTYAALGQEAKAAEFYRAASRLPFTYYGQLAMEELGEKRIRLSPAPQLSAAERARLDQRADIQVLRALIAADAMYEAGALALAITGKDKEIAVQGYVADLMKQAGYHRYQVIIGKRALGEGLPLAAHAYPSPSFGKPKLHVEKALIYAIARQESEFNPQAISHANAMGLVQVLPETARRTASEAGMKYDRGKLLSDPAYNMAIGSYYLNKRVGQFGGSLPMAIASYNAGESRVAEWVPRFGDPRGSKDAIDWVERIPFGETRNYVQRVLENLQIYRALLEDKPLNLKRDLYGG